MRPHLAKAVEVVGALRAVGAEVRLLSEGNPTVLRADGRHRSAFVAIHEDGHATCLPRNPDLPLVPWAPAWATWLAGGP